MAMQERIGANRQWPEKAPGQSERHYALPNNETNPFAPAGPQ
jgi:hypothetical protein